VQYSELIIEFLGLYFRGIGSWKRMWVFDAGKFWDDIFFNTSLVKIDTGVGTE